MSGPEIKDFASADVPYHNNVLDTLNAAGMGVDDDCSDSHDCDDATAHDTDDYTDDDTDIATNAGSAAGGLCGSGPGRRLRTLSVTTRSPCAIRATRDQSQNANLTREMLRGASASKRELSDLCLR